MNCTAVIVTDVEETETKMGLRRSGAFATGNDDSCLRPVEA